MNETEETFLELAQRLRDCFSNNNQDFPYELTNTLCSALAEDRKKDAMILFNLLKDYLIEKNLTYLLCPQSNAATTA